MFFGTEYLCFSVVRFLFVQIKPVMEGLDRICTCLVQARFSCGWACGQMTLLNTGLEPGALLK